jgi:NAD(P)H-nitrite reductase large subunit
MACPVHTAATPLLQEAAPYKEAVPRAMTRCECAEMSFHEIAHRLDAEGRTLDELARRTGCGRTCTACLPDLERFLASR